MTGAEAVDNAARLLKMAETEVNPQFMERYEKIADSWVSIAGMLFEKERV